MTTKSKHNMVAAVAPCTTQLNRRSTLKDIDTFIASAVSIVNESATLGTRLGQSVVMDSEYNEILTRHAQSLHRELALLNTDIGAHRNSLKTLSDLTDDEQFMIGSLHLSGSILESIERFDNLGTPEISAIETIINKIEGHSNDE